MEINYQNLRTCKWWLYGSSNHAAKSQACLPDGREDYDEPVNYTEYKAKEKRVIAKCKADGKAGMNAVPKGFKPVALRTYIGE
jgi:hypothetical protein